MKADKAREISKVNQLNETNRFKKFLYDLYIVCIKNVREAAHNGDYSTYVTIKDSMKYDESHVNAAIEMLQKDGYATTWNQIKIGIITEYTLHIIWKE